MVVAEEGTVEWFTGGQGPKGMQADRFRAF
jgi:hypothetical protein